METNTYIINGETLTSIADAIREKNGSTETYSPSEMSTAIQELQLAGVDLSDELATQDQLISNISTNLYGKFVSAGQEDLSAELTEQDTLISNISAVLERRTAVSEEDLSDELTSQDELISALSAILDTKLGV